VCCGDRRRSKEDGEVWMGVHRRSRSSTLSTDDDGHVVVVEDTLSLMAKDVNKVEAKTRGPSSKSKARHAISREEQSSCHHYPLERTEERYLCHSLYTTTRGCRSNPVSLLHI
jgi:hypothetical protein